MGSRRYYTLIASLPPEIVSTAHEPFGGRAVIYCMLLNKDDGARKAQLQRLAEYADPAVFKETERMMPHVGKIGPECRLPLVDIAISALKNMSERQYDTFAENINQLVAADEKIDLFEYTLQRMILRHLEPAIRETKPPSVRHTKIKSLVPDCVVLLSSLAHWGNTDAIEAQRAFAKGAKKLAAGIRKTVPPIRSSNHVRPSTRETPAPPRRPRTARIRATPTRLAWNRARCAASPRAAGKGCRVSRSATRTSPVNQDRRMTRRNGSARAREESVHSSA